MAPGNPKNQSPSGTVSAEDDTGDNRQGAPGKFLVTNEPEESTIEDGSPGTPTLQENNVQWSGNPFGGGRSRPYFQENPLAAGSQGGQFFGGDDEIDSNTISI
jgi:hypothetical protein